MLPRFIAVLAGLGLALGLSAAGFAAAASRTAVPAAASPAYGVLWKIERGGTPASYLFGTVHLADTRVTNLPPLVDKTFAAAATLTTELFVDAEALVQLMAAMFFTAGQTLEHAVGPALYADVRAAFAERGLPLADLNKYKPWAVAMILSLPAPTGAAPLDLQLQLRAEQAGKPVDGLETVQEQVGVFDGLAANEQRALLDAAVRERQTAGAQLEALVQAYLARDLGRVRTMFEERAAADPTLRDRLIDRLLTSRNRRMVERLHPRLQRGNAFIAVGAAHLPGPGGMLELLEREGYRVHAIY